MQDGGCSIVRGCHKCKSRLCSGTDIDGQEKVAKVKM
jgi:hypothetical protein